MACDAVYSYKGHAMAETIHMMQQHAHREAGTMAFHEVIEHRVWQA